MSREVSTWLVVFNSGYYYEEVENMPISQYRQAINQCVNKANLLSGGGFDYLTNEDKQIELEAEHRMLFPEEWIN